MALADNSTKMFPTKSGAKGTLVGLNLIITDDDRPDLGAGAQVVINETITRQYQSGGMTNPVATAIGTDAQALIDKYKSLRSKYDNATYGTKVTQIKGALNL
jgi:hypothetical protein